MNNFITCVECNKDVHNPMEFVDICGDYLCIECADELYVMCDICCDPFHINTLNDPYGDYICGECAD